MSGATVNNPHGWKSGKPVESAEGCFYPTWKREETMDRETFRQKTLDGDERIRNTRIVWNHMSSEQQQMFLAGEKAMKDNDSVTNAFIDKLVANFNSNQWRSSDVSYATYAATDADLEEMGVTRTEFDRVVDWFLTSLLTDTQRSERPGTGSCSTGSCGCG